MKKLLSLVLIAAMLLSLTACITEEEESDSEIITETQTESETETETETETEPETEPAEKLPEGKMRSFYTGEIIDEEVGRLRPFALMTNNIQDSLPQSGISQAEIVYECIVEGNITRLMSVIQDTRQLTKMGSIRSARHYYIDLANDNDAIFCHYGWSIFAQERIQNNNIPTINHNSVAYYRSTDRYAPHNVFTSGELLEQGAAAINTDRELPEDYKSRFEFNIEGDVVPDGEDATYVVIPFSTRATFDYNADEQIYYKSQYGSPHIDNENKQQLTFKNGIIQFVTYERISEKDHQDLGLFGKGDGYYFSDGKYIPITWEKKDENDITRFYTMDGEPLKLNMGKTYIALCPIDYEITWVQ
ncbi:MAG: DUF3048 domain-containing protein [Lachnospiraceae bacterium]|nr:DUF3048 domain-containing protein [Lachnospiraceae bacterium]